MDLCHCSFFVMCFVLCVCSEADIAVVVSKVEPGYRLLRRCVTAIDEFLLERAAAKLSKASISVSTIKT